MLMITSSPARARDILQRGRGVKKVSARISLFSIACYERQSISRPVPGLYVPNRHMKQGLFLCADQRSMRDL